MIATIQYLAAADRDIGCVRKTNQDAVYTWLSDHDIPTALLIVADGIGGGEHPAGDIASQLAVSTIADTLLPELKSSISTGLYSVEKLEKMLVHAIVRAHNAIFNAGQHNAKLLDMGTTVACVLFRGYEAIIAHVGDSRVYLYNGSNLEQLTCDHSAVGELIEDGLLDPEDIYTHPLRNIITRFLGVNLQVEVETDRIDLMNGDRLLLCTDGLWAMVRDAQIECILDAAPTPKLAVNRLITRALKNGGEDNVCAAVCDVHAIA